jgi:hypothetical protein
MRRSVTVLQERYRVSERLVCRVMEQHRSIQSQQAKVVVLEEAKLSNRLPRLLLSTSAGAGGWLVACFGDKAGA